MRLRGGKASSEIHRLEETNPRQRVAICYNPFTAHEFTGCLETARIRISMDGRGRALDNIFVERLWRSVKYEDIYLKDYTSVPELATGLTNYFIFYNHERLHQSLGYRTPAEVHFA
jgi:putative transposase